MSSQCRSTTSIEIPGCVKYAMLSAIDILRAFQVSGCDILKNYIAKSRYFVESGFLAKQVRLTPWTPISPSFDRTDADWVRSSFSKHVFGFSAHTTFSTCLDSSFPKLPPCWLEAESRLKLNICHFQRQKEHASSSFTANHWKLQTKERKDEYPCCSSACLLFSVPGAPFGSTSSPKNETWPIMGRIL